MQNNTPRPAGILRDGGYAWYVVFLLTFAYTVAFVDRQVLNLLVDPLKKHMLLTDVQVSLLQGFAFMTAYITFGPVFGRWVDSGHRRNALAAGVTLWSLGTIGCGLSDSYWQLFCARAVVGAAEACLAPAGFSLIADYFTRERLPRAMSIFMLGPSLGGGLALIAGSLVIGSTGALAQTFPVLSGMAPWQLTFVMVGAPGLLLALWLFTVREPERGSLGAAAKPDRHFALSEVFAFFWTHKAFYGRYFIGLSLLAIVVYGFPTWMPAYLMRQYGVPPSSVGLRYGAQVLLVGSLGIYCGPWLERWFIARRNPTAALQSAKMCAVLVAILCAIFPLAKTYESTLALAGVINFIYAMPWAVTAAALQITTPNRMRGIAVSIYYFLISIFGLGIAPSLIAFFTEHVLGDPAKVGTSLAIVCTVSAVASAWLLHGAEKHFRTADT